MLHAYESVRLDNGKYGVQHISTGYSPIIHIDGGQHETKRQADIVACNFTGISWKEKKSWKELCKKIHSEIKEKGKK